MARVIFREKALDDMLNSPRGMVGRYLRGRGLAIKAAAKGQVGFKTGALRASIHMRHSRDARGQYVKIGSPLSYAQAHHEGTKPHLITPKTRGALRFFTDGFMVFAHKVRHPGTRPNRYLTDNLRLIK